MEDSHPKLRFTQFSYSIITGNHREEIQLFVIPSPHSPVVLGLPWFKLRKPHTDLRNTSITNWSIHCHYHCLRSANPSSPHLQVLPPQIDLSAVPLEYFDLALKGAAPPTEPHLLLVLQIWVSIWSPQATLHHGPCSQTSRSPPTPHPASVCGWVCPSKSVFLWEELQHGKQRVAGPLL